MPPSSENSGRAFLWGSLFIAAAVLFAVGGLCGYLYRGSTEKHDGDTPRSSREAERKETVSALGRIEPKDGILSLGVSVPDRIRRILVKEGHSVKKGDRLALFESEEMRKLELQLARIQRSHAEMRLRAITANGDAQIHVEELRRDRAKQLEPLEIKALEDKIDFLKEQEKNAGKNSLRYVAAGDSIATQVREKQELALYQAKSERRATESQLKKLSTSSKLDRGLIDAQLKALADELKQNQIAISRELLDAQIKQAEQRLKEAEFVAPVGGKILNVLVHEGEIVGAKPILQMANLDQMIVLVEVYEGDIEYVLEGQTATITSDIGRIFQEENALRGKVIERAGIVGRPRVISADPLAAVDKHVVEVKVALELTEEQAAKVADLIGHQVQVKIDTNNQKSR